MKKHTARRLLTVITAFFMLALSACGATGASGGNDDFVLDTNLISYNDELVFSFTLTDFINAYNAHYRADYGEDYLRQKSGWTRFANDVSPFSTEESDYYRFLYDETDLTFPMIAVYTPSGAEAVQGITIDFDDHGYSSHHYAVYEVQCFYALKTVFCDTDSSILTQVYNELFDYAYENIKEEGLDALTVPDIMYCRDNVGVFSHFAYGDYVRLCIVPVSAEHLEELRENGTDIRDIQSVL